MESKNNEKLQKLKTVLENNGDKLISTEYNPRNIIYECHEHGIKNTLPGRILDNKYCQGCGVKKARQKNPKIGVLKLEEVKSRLEKRNLILLENEYIGQTIKMKMKCKQGHTFELSLKNVEGGCGCQICNTFISEKICRKYMEIMFGKPFNKIRPDFLKMPNGYNLELDGYNDELKISFEYNGKHHYEQLGYYHDDDESFQKRLDYDAHKYKKCSENGINIIIVPYTVSMDNMQSYIISECDKLNINIPNRTLINYIDLDINNTNPNVEKLDKILKSLNITRISSYFGDRKNIKVRCDTCSSEYEKTPKALYGNHASNVNYKLCITCYKKKRINLLDDVLAKSDYKCVGDYVNLEQTMDIKCMNCGEIRKINAGYILEKKNVAKCKCTNNDFQN